MQHTIPPDYLERLAAGEIPELRDEQGESPHPLILDPKSPMVSAHRYLRDHCTGGNGERLLLYHHEQFFRWDKTHFHLVAPADLNTSIYHFLEKAVKPNSKKDLVPFNPNRSRVAEVISALSAITLVKDIEPPAWLSKQVPCWSDGLRSYPIEARHIVTTQNGLLHLPSGVLFKHNPLYFNINCTDYNFDREAPVAEEWLKFLASLWLNEADTIETLQEIFGYCLTAETAQQKAFLMIGPTRSGKGTIARVLQAVIGDVNVAAPTLTSLGGEHGLWPLIGKQLAVISDARLSPRSDQAPVVERLLQITGEDTISTNRKYLPYWTGRITAKLLLISNELPQFVDQSQALLHRLIVLVFTKSFLHHEDHGLTDRLVAERASILNWAVAGYRRLRERGHFQQPKSAIETIADLAEIVSPISAFIRDRCLVEAGTSVDRKELYRAWREWCQEEGRDGIGTAAMFGRNLRAACPEIGSKQARDDGARARFYTGIRLRW